MTIRRRSPGRGLAGALALAAVYVGVAGALGGCRRNRMLARGDAAAVVVVAPDAAPALPSSDEVEPNDLPATAQTLTLGEADGLTVRGTLLPRSGKSDVDVYRLITAAAPDAGVVVLAPEADAASSAAGDGGTVSPPRIVAFELTPAAQLSCQLQVLDGGGKLLVAVTGAAGERCVVPNLAVAPGAALLVKVRKVQSSGKLVAAAVDAGGDASYALTVRVTQPETADEREPNDVLPTPAATGGNGLPTPGARDPGGNAFGGTAAVEERAGFFGWARDQDVWQLPLDSWPSDGQLTVELEGVDGVEAGLSVQDEAGRVVAGARGRMGERLVLRQLATPPAVPGQPRAVLSIVVRAERGSRADRRYVLRVRQDLHEPGSEREPNDDPPRATPLTEGAARGYLASGDLDVHRLELSGPAEIDASVTGIPRVDVVLSVLGPDGVVLQTADGARRGEGERLPNVFVERGPVYLRVAGHRGESNPDEPYALKVQASSPVADGEREPNGVVDRATTLNLTATGTGLLAPDGDVDLWAVSLPAATPAFQVAVRGPAGIASELTIETRAGRVLARVPVGPGEELRRPVAVQGETALWLRLRAAPRRRGQAAVPAERYALSVTLP